LKKDFKVGFASGYMIASSSKDARIKELEARLKTAEKLLKDYRDICFNWNDKKRVKKIDAFLTNKTE